MKRGGVAVTMACPICGRKFDRYPSQIAARGAKFCSFACRVEGQKKRKPIVCKNCGKTSPGLGRKAGLNRGKFCDLNCYREWDRKNRTIEFDCDHCGKHVRRGVASQAKAKGGRGRFCSRECAFAYQVGANHHAHRGDLRPQRGARWRAVAVEVRERDGYRCRRCGSPEVIGKAIAVDHIIPAREFGPNGDAASSKRNLACLCASCHAVKTTRIEPRMLRGDWLALLEFYGADVYEQAKSYAAEARARGWLG